MAVSPASPAPPRAASIRISDPFTDGARAGARDPFTDGARNGARDTFSDGA
ncbi:signal peptide protein [Cupriavidus basilensis OR16]|uniref:Signal peptide protein n=1 Tax=Cupriavidus basilensis OR16 TaxID=1127483 RepID=H1RYS1_9BURK|nr:signal peptide protein [Cupriavidus basilensis OR16]